MQKADILQKVIFTVEDEIKALESSAGSSHQMSVEAPSAMQSHSDTTKFQMKALEENTRKSILEKETFIRNTRELISKLSEDAEKIESGSLVGISDESGIKQYVVLEGGAGIIVEDGDKQWIVVTTASPLGKALLGKKKGEKFVFSAGGKDKELEIFEVK